MSLLEDVKNWSTEDSYAGVWEMAEDVGASLKSEDVVGTWRWGTIHEAILERDNEYVRVGWQQASGDGDCDFEPSFEEVIPVEKVVIEWQKKK